MTNAARMGQAGQVGAGSTGKTTTIEDDTEIKGTLSSKCPVVVKGSVEGEVIGPSLHVSPSGSVSGKVKVGELRSEGSLAGEVDAESVLLAGTVKNDTIIRARSLEVRLAQQGSKLQVSFGQCELAVGDVPTQEEAVSAATARPATTARAGIVPAGDDAATQTREGDRAATESEAAGAARSRARRENSNASGA